MENTLLRRMNLRSFLVVPVQRVTKYVLFFVSRPPLKQILLLFLPVLNILKPIMSLIL